MGILYIGQVLKAHIQRPPAVYLKRTESPERILMGHENGWGSRGDGPQEMV